VDEQLIGPYGHWHHLHQFTEQGDETIIYDRITYELPSYLPRLFQNIINRVYVTAALQQIFDYRQQVFADIFGSGKNITSPLKN
jgi:ligand-binding SRPBCC domain-containing protein